MSRNNSRVFSTLLYLCLLSFIRGTVSQSGSSNFSPCFTSCLGTTESNFNCDDPNDTTCLCSTAAINDFASCLKTSCTTDDINQARTFLLSLCDFGDDSDGSDDSDDSDSSDDSSSGASSNTGGGGSTGE
ncbi:hypothetical protein BDN70DRAFT_931678 [Pholiota conissans]|uniref:CFEM domain-containing protein n=1 Tax=Pholiota conissans TaxID=109636 RepID=A0A9P5Z317_9AGAR|nr:hypothetical protein BDN70DRAFT_931678 [Pholiota conissans]